MAARKFCFGPFEVDVETGELRKNGCKIRLQEKSFQVLIALLERRGNLVSREQLRQRLWAPDTFVDFENGLNTAVSKLRDALGDPAEVSRYVETLSRRGYRFVAPIEESPATATTSSRDLTLRLKRIPPEITVVEIAGKIVFGLDCQPIEWLVSDLLRRQEKKIIFDVSEVTYIDSTGVGIIVVAFGKVSRDGGELCLAGATAMVERMLKISRVDQIVALYPTVAAAVESLSRAA